MTTTQAVAVQAPQLHGTAASPGQQHQSLSLPPAQLHLRLPVVPEPWRSRRLVRRLTLPQPGFADPTASQRQSLPMLRGRLGQRSGRSGRGLSNGRI